MAAGWRSPHGIPEPGGSAVDPSDFWDDRAEGLRYRAAMITIATSYFWYFSYDSSLAVGGSRSI
jgi:hypothetical protein